MRGLVFIGCGLLLSHCQVGHVWKGEGGSLLEPSTGTGTSAGSGFSDPPAAPAPSAPVAPVLISPDAPGCARGQIATALVPVHFLFTIDRSGSMNDADAAHAALRPTKWQALQAAMEALFKELGDAAAAGDNSVAVGINYFSEATDDNSGPETMVELPPAPLDQARASALTTDIAGRSAQGETPTQAALSESYQSLLDYQPSGVLANGQKVVVLVSDGRPNPAPADPATIPDLVAAKLAGSPPLRTFSIGVGELGSTGDFGYDAIFMSTVADRGGTGKAGCDPTSSDPAKFCHFQITPSQSSNITADFLAAFNAIRDQVGSCDLALNIQDVIHLEPRAVVVVEQSGGTQKILQADPINGWTFDNDLKPTLIRLHGQDCTSYRHDHAATVFAILGCTCGTVTGPGAGSSSGGGEGTAVARDVVGEGSSSGGGFNTNWCSYPFATPPGTCAGEGCPPGG